MTMTEPPPPSLKDDVMTVEFAQIDLAALRQAIEHLRTLTLPRNLQEGVLQGAGTPRGVFRHPDGYGGANAGRQPCSGSPRPWATRELEVSVSDQVMDAVIALTGAERGFSRSQYGYRRPGPASRP